MCHRRQGDVAPLKIISNHNISCNDRSHRIDTAKIGQCNMFLSKTTLYSPEEEASGDLVSGFAGININ